MDKCKRCQDKLEIGFARNGFTHCGWCANVELSSEQEENAGLYTELRQQAAEIERLREALAEARPYVEGMHKCAPAIRHETLPLLEKIDQALAQR